MSLSCHAEEADGDAFLVLDEVWDANGTNVYRQDRGLENLLLGLSPADATRFGFTSEHGSFSLDVGGGSEQPRRPAGEEDAEHRVSDPDHVARREFDLAREAIQSQVKERFPDAIALEMYDTADSREAPVLVPMRILGDGGKVLWLGREGDPVYASLARYTPMLNRLGPEHVVVGTTLAGPRYGVML